MGDRVHFKVTFKVRPGYQMTQEMAVYAWSKFNSFEYKASQTYEVAGSRTFGDFQSGFQTFDVPRLAEAILVYVQGVFPKIGFDFIEFWMQVEQDE